MFGLRSAQARSVLAGALLVALLASVAALAVWRTQDMQERHHALEHTSAEALTLEHAQTQFLRGMGAVSSLVFSDDPALLDRYHEAGAEVEHHLSEARASSLSQGEADKVLALDDLSERIAQFNERAKPALPSEADLETATLSAIASMAEMVPQADAMIADLEEMAHEEQHELAATRAAADRAAETTLWLLTGFSAFAFLVAAGTIAMLIVSVVRPLVSLRASARAITSGDLEARAKISGPEEVTSLARDFNEMTDALSAKREELELRAVTDSLTGLYNHAHFYQRLAEEIERSKRYNHDFAVVMMDVDAFKHYNDSRGHQGGDEALRLVGECIQSALRRSDLAFRYGGDEFVAILPHTESSRAQAAVKRINKRIAARLKEMDDPAAAWLGLSAGVACFPDDATTVDELVRTADAALYNAKQLAWARGVTARGQRIESPSSPPKLVHETQSRMLSVAAGSLVAVLEDLGASNLVTQLDLRAIAAVGAAAEIKDPYIRGHQERTSLWAAALAEEIGLPPERVRDIRIASLLHDLGKVTVSEGVLNKPGKLTEEEYSKVKQHAPLGATIMVSEAEALQQLATVVRHHHERFDGQGYPDGLAGEDIPLEARILSVADVFDAMTHKRAYRNALSTEETIAELERGAGTQFDPAVVEAFLALLKRRDEEPAAPAQAVSEHKQLAAARAPGRRKG